MKVFDVVVGLGAIAAIASAQQTIVNEEDSAMDYQYMMYLARFNKSHRSLTEYNLRMHEF